MQASRLAEGHRELAFGLIEAYFVVLVTCGAVALGFTARFFYQNRAEFPNLVKIIRYRAPEDAADIDLENGKNDQWERDSMYSNEDDPAGQGYGDTEAEDPYGLRGWTHRRGYHELDWDNGGREYRDNDDSPADVEVLDNEGEGDGDDEAEEDDPAASGYGDTETEDEENPDRWWCRFCREYQTPSWRCSCKGEAVWSRPKEEGEDQDGHDRSRYDNEGEDNDGEGDDEAEEDDDDGEGDDEAEENDPAGIGCSDAESEEEYDPHNDGDYICTKDHRHGWTCPKDYGDSDWNNRYEHRGRGNYNGSRYENPWDYDSPRYNNEGANNEDEDDHQHDCPGSNNDSETLHLTPSSSGSDAEVNATSPAPPPTFGNWYAAPADDDDNESCSSCDSEHAKTIPWTTPAAHREPLTPTSPSGYVAGIEDNDDGEESDVSDGATIGELEGEDTETWDKGDSRISYGSTPGQGFQSERENTGPLDNVQEPSDQTTIAQERRPQHTGTAFSPPHLPARHANILADETGHDQGPPVGEFRRGITRPLRLMIPTQRITIAEPKAPTTPTTTQSLAQWPGTAYAENSWRDM